MGQDSNTGRGKAQQAVCGNTLDHSATGAAPYCFGDTDRLRDQKNRIKWTPFFEVLYPS